MSSTTALFSSKKRGLSGLESLGLIPKTIVFLLVEEFEKMGLEKLWVVRVGGEEKEGRRWRREMGGANRETVVMLTAHCNYYLFFCLPNYLYYI